MEYYNNREMAFSGTGSKFPVKDEELQDPINVASGFNTFFITVTERNEH